MTRAQKIEIIESLKNYAEGDNTHGYVWTVTVANIVAHTLYGKYYLETRSGYPHTNIINAEQKAVVRNEIEKMEVAGCLVRSKTGKAYKVTDKLLNWRA